MTSNPRPAGGGLNQGLFGFCYASYMSHWSRQSSRFSLVGPNGVGAMGREGVGSLQNSGEGGRADDVGRPRASLLDRAPRAD